jgi:hypothetical protein
MARGPGGGSGGATLQRSKLSLTQKVRQTEPKLDQGSGGGNMGKGIFNGGGGDGGDDDDDDYLGDGEGDGDDGSKLKGFLRALVAQLYDEPSLAAVLTEWGRTMGDLPAIIRQQVAMGLFSSAQLGRFLAVDARPSTVRALTRLVPASAARDIVGRLMADPAFVQKAVVEQALTAALALRYEAAARGDRFWREADYVALNVLALCAANAVAVWSLAPSRAAGAARPFAAALSGVPNHAFDASSPARRFTGRDRLASVAARGAELALAGGAAGGAMAAGGAGLTALRRALGDAAFEPSAPVPAPRTVLGMAAAGAVFTNGRHQALGGAERWLFDRAASLLGVTLTSAGLRAAGALAASEMRLFVQGLPSHAALAARAAAAKAAAAAPKRRRRRVAAVAAPGAASDAALAADAGDGAAPAAPPRRRRKASSSSPSSRRAVGFEMSAAAA